MDIEGIDRNLCECRSSSNQGVCNGDVLRFCCRNAEKALGVDGVGRKPVTDEADHGQRWLNKFDLRRFLDDLCAQQDVDIWPLAQEMRQEGFEFRHTHLDVCLSLNVDHLWPVVPRLIVDVPRSAWNRSGNKGRHLSATNSSRIRLNRRQADLLARRGGDPRGPADVVRLDVMRD